MNSLRLSGPAPRQPRNWQDVAADDDAARPERCTALYHRLPPPRAGWAASGGLDRLR